MQVPEAIAGDWRNTGDRPEIAATSPQASAPIGHRVRPSYAGVRADDATRPAREQSYAQAGFQTEHLVAQC